MARAAAPAAAWPRNWRHASQVIALFAFALGVCVGILTRQALPAMAITLAVFVTVQVAVPTLVRAHLAPPETTTAAITAETRQGRDCTPR